MRSKSFFLALEINKIYLVTVITEQKIKLKIESENIKERHGNFSTTL